MQRCDADRYAAIMRANGGRIPQCGSRCDPHALRICIRCRESQVEPGKIVCRECEIGALDRKRRQKREASRRYHARKRRGLSADRRGSAERPAAAAPYQS